MQNKNKFILLDIGLAGVALIGGAFALFTSTSEEVKSSVAGSVKTNVSDILFENSTNLNPGDNDPSLNPDTLPDDPDDPNNPERPKGTPHDLTFDVENEGSKSIRTKHEFTITMGEGYEHLDPSIFFITSDTQDENGKDIASEIHKKYYKVAPENKYIEASDLDSYLTENPDSKIVEVKYVVSSDIFDGVGENSEKEDLSSVKPGLESVKEGTKKHYTYSLAMSQHAKDEYQGAKMNVNVAVYSMQYRNNDASGWYKVSEQNLEGRSN